MIPYFLGAFTGIKVLEGSFWEYLTLIASVILAVIVLLILAIFGILNLLAINPDIIAGSNSIWAATSLALIYVLWSVIFCWLLYHFAVFPKSKVTRMFSANFWKPLGRASLGAYLVHFMLIWFYVYQTRVLIVIVDFLVNMM